MRGHAPQLRHGPEGREPVGTGRSSSWRESVAGDRVIQQIAAQRGFIRSGPAGGSDGRADCRCTGVGQARSLGRYAVPEGSTCPPPSTCHTRPIGEFSEAKASPRMWRSTIQNGYDPTHGPRIPHREQGCASTHAPREAETPDCLPAPVGNSVEYGPWRVTRQLAASDCELACDQCLTRRSAMRIGRRGSANRPCGEDGVPEHRSRFSAVCQSSLAAWCRER